MLLAVILSIPFVILAFGLPIALGEVASVLTASQRTVPERTLATGFQFQFPELEPALRNLLHKR